MESCDVKDPKGFFREHSPCQAGESCRSSHLSVEKTFRVSDGAVHGRGVDALRPYEVPVAQRDGWLLKFSSLVQERELLTANCFWGITHVQIRSSVYPAVF